MEHWQITQEKVQSVIRKIVEVGRPTSIILFGSYVRGQTGPNSDLDVLVVVDARVKNCRQESVRIRKALKDISMPMDILVVRSRDLKELRNVPGLVYETVLNEGKVVYERAA